MANNKEWEETALLVHNVMKKETEIYFGLLESETIYETKRVTCEHPITAKFAYNYPFLRFEFNPTVLVTKEGFTLTITPKGE